MMRNILLLFSLVVSIGMPQENPETAPDTVVAVVNGRKMRADEIKKMVAPLPTQVQQAFTNDPHQFLKEYAWYLVQQEAAMKHELDKQSPYKELLEFQRMMTLVQAERNDAYLKLQVTPEQQKSHYEANLEKYQETKAKLIYIPFGGSGAEDEAKAKAEKVVQQARGGVDFVNLVKEYSQDSTSAAQNGDMGMAIRSTTQQVPEPMRNAILALKAGQVSDPIRHENGYYVFRAESAGVLPYEKVKDDIYKELKDVAFAKWEQKTKGESSVQFENEAFFQSIKQQAQTAAKPNGK